MKKILFAALIAFSTTAFATPPGQAPAHGYYKDKTKPVVNVPAPVSNTTGDTSVSTSVSNTNTYEAAASTAYGPALTSGSDTCMGSTSVGGSGVGFGFSVGSTWTDENCVMLKNARLLYGMGQDKVAFALMCQDEDVRAAAAAAKVNMCPPVEKKETKGSDAPSQGWTF